MGIRAYRRSKDLDLRAQTFFQKWPFVCAYVRMRHVRLVVRACVRMCVYKGRSGGGRVPFAVSGSAGVRCRGEIELLE